MKILIVEDDNNKRRHLVELVREAVPSAAVEECGSYQSGLSAALANDYDLLILDMSMPTFDSMSGTSGQHRRFAGRDIIRELDRRRRVTRAIVVTQFETFGEGSNRRTLDELHEELARNYAAIYDSIVYYHAAQSDWREALGRRVAEVGRKLHTGGGTP